MRIALCLMLCASLANAADQWIDPNPQPAPPQIPDRSFNLRDFGAVGDGKTANTDAFRHAIEQIARAGGGRLVVPKGVYRTQPFALCSNLDLHLDAGALIQAPANFADYDLPDPATMKNQDDVKARVPKPLPLISGKNLHDLAITGEGTIDGSGEIWWQWSERAARGQPNRAIYPRQHMIVISNCQRLHIQGVTLKNSPMFHLVPTDVSDLLIEQIKIATPIDSPNTDGIDPTRCSNVIIRDCDFDTGDDDIAIKSGGEKILVENCRVHHGHGISIGSETSAGISDMLVRHCTFNQTDNGLRIKSMRGAGGLVHNIHYTDIQMTDVKNAIVLDLLYTDANRPNFRGDPSKLPKIEHIQIDHVSIENSHNAGKIVGLPDSHIDDVTLRDVRISAQNDFVIQNADRITFDHVDREIASNKATTQAK
jgi:polygalacturonase